ncbi:MAG: hypothetical protein KGO82_18210, partial [Bacteroidota bacterium]|nr:hypothetical protein [Bacteroidota bacterium]
WKMRPACILVYDCIPLLSLRLFYRIIRRPKILWYHNHDVADPKYLRKWSINWGGWKSESWIFPKLDIFSLPSVERTAFFPMERLKGAFFFLPNFPSLSVYAPQRQQRSAPHDHFRILYQGSIGELHGLEEIIGLLPENIAGKTWSLVLKGFVDEAYFASLQHLAADKGVSDRLSYIGPTGYMDVVKNAMSCHVGIGIHKKDDIMNNTLGTASNKIYEYAAAGMPVLVYDNTHFREALAQREWVLFTDTSARSLREVFGIIAVSYEALSKAAEHDFLTTYCFENYFSSVFNHLNKN